jgi:hypothetical protein
VLVQLGGRTNSGKFFGNSSVISHHFCPIRYSKLNLDTLIVLGFCEEFKLFLLGIDWGDAYNKEF